LRVLAQKLHHGSRLRRRALQKATEAKNEAGSISEMIDKLPKAALGIAE
jgi:hypothetical protein